MTRRKVDMKRAKRHHKSISVAMVNIQRMYSAQTQHHRFKATITQAALASEQESEEHDSGMVSSEQASEESELDGMVSSEQASEESELDGMVNSELASEESDIAGS